MKIFSIKSKCFFFFFLIVSCQIQRKEIPKSISIAETIVIPEQLNIGYVEIIDSLGYTILEEGDDSFLGYISKLRVYQNKIYVLDARYAKSLFIYAKNGLHIATIGSNKGRGPLDFVSVTNFEIDYINNQLLVMDNWGSKFMIYDLEGTFIKRIESELYVTNAVLLPNDFIMHAKSSFESKIPNQGSSCLLITDMNKKIVKEGFIYDDNKHINISTQNFINSQFGGKISYSPKFRDTIYYVSFDSIVPRYAIDYGKNRVISQNQISNLSSPFELFDLIKAGNLCYMGNHVETNNYLYLMLGYILCPTHIFYNKKTNNTIALSHKADIGEFEDELFNILCSDEEGFFYGSFNFAGLMELVKLFPELQEIDQGRDLNPILFRYKLKI